MRWGPCISRPKLHNLRQNNVWWFDLFRICKSHFGLNLFAPLSLIKLICILRVSVSSLQSQLNKKNIAHVDELHGIPHFCIFAISSDLVNKEISSKCLQIIAMKVSLLWGLIEGKSGYILISINDIPLPRSPVSIKWGTEHPAFIVRLWISGKNFIPDSVSDKLLETRVAFEVPG